MANLIDITNLTDGGLDDLLRIAGAGNGDAELTEGKKSNADLRAVSDLLHKRSGVRPSLHWGALYREG